MKMQTLRSTLLIIWAFLGLIVPISNLYAPPAMPVGGQPQISEEDLKFLEDLGKQIQDEVAKLPTRAQLKAQGLSDIEIERGEKQGKIQTKDKFDEDVAKYSAMSEEELYAEMEKALAEVEKASTPEAQPEYPSAGIYQGEAEAPTPAPTPVPTKPAVPSNKQQAAIQLIDSLLAHINNFLSKAQTMVELPGKITSWIKEGKLKNWPATLNWNSFRGQVEELQAKLNKIKDKDAKTGSYKYLDDLIKDESTYNNLVKIKDALARSEPKISLSSFGIDKMTTAGRQAVRDALLSLYEAVSTLGIAASLDKIIEKYEPTAKKIKESEEAAQRKALEESRRGRTPGYTTVGGYPKYEGDYRGRYDFGDGGHGFTPGKFEAPEREKAREESSKKDKAAAAGAGGAAKPEVKKPEEKKPAAEKPKREEDKTATDLLKDFNSGIFQIIDAFDISKNLAKLEAHMKDDTFVDEDLYKEAIPQLVEGINKTLRAAKLLKRQLGKKTLNDEQKKEFKKDIREGLKEAKGDLEKLSKQLENIDKAGASTLVTGVASRNELFTQAKKYAYFGKKNEADFKAKLDADKKRVADTALPVPKDIDQLEKDIKQAEPLLANKDLADLSKVNDKIKELQKAVAEL